MRWLVLFSRNLAITSGKQMVVYKWTLNSTMIFKGHMSSFRHKRGNHFLNTSKTNNFCWFCFILSSETNRLILYLVFICMYKCFVTMYDFDVFKSLNWSIQYFLALFDTNTFFEHSENYEIAKAHTTFSHTNGDAK